jgi:hypothetical protein
MTPKIVPFKNKTLFNKMHKHLNEIWNGISRQGFSFGLVLWCLRSLLTIFQLYRVGQFY